MMLGSSLLVASVVEPGQRQRPVWLPAGSDWYDFWTGTRHEGGQSITLPAPLDGDPPLLARAGCAIPLNLAEAHFGRATDVRGFQLFPLAEGTFEAECFEDDGHTQRYRQDGWGTWRLRVNCTADALLIAIERGGPRPPAGDRMALLLPSNETRGVEVEGAGVVADAPEGLCRRLDLAL
jgi:alpha-glucosidase